MKNSFLRGHDIIFSQGEWLYKDTLTPTAGNERPCGNCGGEYTEEGHDKCLGTLPGVMNACCGHGVKREAYVQIDSKNIVKGTEALKLIEQLRSAFGLKDNKQI